MTEDGEPLNTEERSLRELKRAMYINVTEYAVSTLDLEPGDDLELHTYRDSIVITRGGDDER